MDKCGSFAFLSNGNGDTLKLYYTPSLVDLISGHRIKESSQSVTIDGKEEDENDKTSLCWGEKKETHCIATRQTNTLCFSFI